MSMRRYAPLLSLLLLLSVVFTTLGPALFALGGGQISVVLCKPGGRQQTLKLELPQQAPQWKQHAADCDYCFTSAAPLQGHALPNTFRPAYADTLPTPASDTVSLPLLATRPPPARAPPAAVNQSDLA